MKKVERELIELIIEESFDAGYREANRWGDVTFYDNEGDKILETRKDMTFVEAYKVILRQVKNSAYISGEIHTQSKIKNAFKFM